MSRDGETHAELEIGLSRRSDGACQVELRFAHPESETEIPPLRGEAPLDPKALLQHQSDGEAYGKALGEALFPDAPVSLPGGQTTTVRAHYRRIETAIEAGGLQLRVRLRLDPSASDLQALRWELLRDPETGRALATSERRLFSRFMASHDWRRVKLPPKSELKALIAVSSPSDLGEGKKYPLAEVDVDGEIARASSSLKGIVAEVVGKEDPLTLNTLVERLRDGIDILYLACHGALSRPDNLPALFLQKADGAAAIVRGAELAARLAELNNPPRLAFLASCESAGAERGIGAEVTAQAALAPRLAEAGVAAIVAMQGKISIKTVEQAVPVFFSELMKDGRIDRALAAARGAVRERHDAWMPALYSRLKSCRLWYKPGFTGVKDEFAKWEAIASDVRSGDFVPVLGPDIAEHLYGSVRERARELAVKHGYPMQPHDRFDLAKVAQFLSVRHSREVARREVADQLKNGIRERCKIKGDGKVFSAAVKKCLQKEDDPFRILTDLRSRVYVTASSDLVLPLALREMGRRPKPLFCKWRKTRDNHPKEPPYEGRATRERPVVFHAFGLDKRGDADSLVLTEDDFLDYLIAAADYKLIPTVVRGSLVKSSLLFLGFPLDDLAFRVLFRLIMSLEGSSQLRDHAHVGVQVDPEEHSPADVERTREYLRDYFQTGAGASAPRVDIYWGTAADFLRELRAQLDKTAVEKTRPEEEEEDEWVVFE